MDIDEALDFVNKLISDKIGKPLNETEIKVLKGAWQGLTYTAIDSLSAEYLEKDVGFKLWRKLTEVLGTKVTKKTFRGVVEGKIREQRSHSAEVPHPQKQAQKETPSNNPDFVGREEAIAHLNTLIASRNAKVIGIYGKGGVGKTALAWQYFKTQGFKVLERSMGMEAQNITSVEHLVRYWLRNDFKQEPEQDFGIMLEQLKHQLQTQRIGVLINDLETALDENGKLLKAHRRYVELLRVLAHPEVQSVTLITSRECLNESTLSVKHYPLLGLDEEAWREFFSRRDVDTASPAFSAMHNAYGGNAKAMGILSSAIQIDYDGNLEAYWQAIQGNLVTEGNLRDLVVSQFNRLQQLNPAAYRLLRRLGCYRYQNVPKVPREGLLCMLWDVPEVQRWRVVQSLQDRFLVEFKNNEYWLHSVIQVEAIERLKIDGEWHLAHREAANFWLLTVSKILQHQQATINQIDWNKVKDSEELLSRLIIAAQPFENWEDNRWTVRAFEAIYHFLEFYDLDSLEELMEQAETLVDPINLSIINWLYELVDSLVNLGLAFHQLGITTYNLAKLDESIGDFEKSIAESEYGKICFDKRQRYFEDAILIANQIKAYNLVEEVQRVRDITVAEK